jgi:hypothetical protein
MHDGCERQFGINDLGHLVLTNRLAAVLVPAGAKMKPKTLSQGTATSVWAATSPALDGNGGLYPEDCQTTETTARNRAYGERAYALDPESARKLWTFFEKNSR